MIDATSRRSLLQSPTSLITAATVLAAVALILSQADYRPIWDGRIYADCISAAAQSPSIAALRCAGHASHAYVAFAAAVQMPAPGSYALLLAANLTLYLLACLGAARLVRHV